MIKIKYTCFKRRIFRLFVYNNCWYTQWRDSKECRIKYHYNWIAYTLINHNISYPKQFIIYFLQRYQDKSRYHNKVHVKEILIFDIIDVITIRKLRWYISIHDMCYTAIIMYTYGRDKIICFVLELDRVRVIYLIFPPISFVPELP